MGNDIEDRGSFSNRDIKSLLKERYDNLKNKQEVKNKLKKIIPYYGNLHSAYKSIRNFIYFKNTRNLINTAIFKLKKSNQYNSRAWSGYYWVDSHLDEITARTQVFERFADLTINDVKEISKTLNVNSKIIKLSLIFPKEICIANWDKVNQNLKLLENELKENLPNITIYKFMPSSNTKKSCDDFLKLFYPVDTHFNALGHEVYSLFLKNNGVLKDH